ncbi:MAG: type II toxin-antitoxin system PemK/MazF family toxin [Candidatus Eremiobacteraeota bacterium]|nr:type II toxin-antitoxin system PemK/MazF family toxin [Candidatus Eremiobacteraeota bacterium]
MSPGQIVAVDWRDARPSTGEPNKRRPGVIVGSPRFFGDNLPFEIVVPLTGKAELAVGGASFLIQPTAENGCTKACFALAWNVQTVPHARLTPTSSRVTDEQLLQIRAQLIDCIDMR